MTWHGQGAVEKPSMSWYTVVMGLSTMQLLTGWESFHGELSSDQKRRFLQHPSIDEICEFPSGLVFTLLRRNSKLDELLADARLSIAAWNENEEAFRRSVHTPEYEVVTDAGFIGDRLYPVNLVGNRSLTYWYDYLYREDGPFEKTDATTWEDYVNGNGQ